ncbi:porin family protein [Fulvivirga sedimenti]|uniref:PorT family protein n=1 Tax=Fulvivirga sedimenti TaxID=2879465 RepID=A0A9X1HVT5_9BACT|nr:porin family protein [Fulvivirga sedimenti]MCA6078855.1 PorT family protein [Fulvivirga sedimenti]
MRKLILSIFFIAVACVSASAQFQLGVKGGMNFAEFKIDNIRSNTKTGYHFGAFTSFKLGKIAVQPEVVFSQQGTEFRFDGQDFQSNFNYINVPVMFKFYLVGGLNVQVGPQFGFLTGATSTFDPIEQIETGESSIRDYYSESDVSLGLGVGWDLPINMNLEFRYNRGLTDISDQNIPATRNQVYQISLGFRLID